MAEERKAGPNPGKRESLAVGDHPARERGQAHREVQRQGHGPFSVLERGSWRGRARSWAPSTLCWDVEFYPAGQALCTIFFF